MLKIRDNVDLKELGCDMDEEDFIWGYKELLFDKETKEILSEQFVRYGDIRLDVLYDLIKADLVEKVDE